MAEKDVSEETLVGTDFSAFIARAFADNGAAMSDIDSLKLSEKKGYHKALKNTERYELYFHDFHVTTRRKCQKAAILLELADQETEEGSDAKQQIKKILFGRWPALHKFILTNSAPLNYDKYLALLQQKKDRPKIEKLLKDFPIFIFIANLLNKKVDYMTPCYNEHYNHFAAEEKRIANNSKFMMALDEKKQKLAASLWQYIKDEFNGFLPLNINEFLNNETVWKDIPNRALLSYGNVHNLPIGEMKTAIIVPKDIEEQIKYLVFLMPKEQVDELFTQDSVLTLTDAVKQDAMRIFCVSFILRAFSIEFKRTEILALKYLTLKDELEKNAGRNKVLCLQNEINELKSQLAKKDWEIRDLHDRLKDSDYRNTIAAWNKS